MKRWYPGLALRITLVYSIPSALWILFSDHMLSRLIDQPIWYGYLTTGKGWGFVAVSTLIIYLILHTSLSEQKRVNDRLVAINQELERQIAERQRIEAALRESEQHFRLLFANNPLPMWVYDRETLAFLEVNDAAIAKYGYTRQEFLQMGLSDIRPPEDLPRLYADLAMPRAAFQDSGEWRHQLKDGRIIDVHIVSHTVELSGRQAVLVVAHDITERKRAEAELRKSEAQFRALFEQAPVGIGISRNGITLAVNPAYLRMFGYADSADLNGTPITMCIAPDEREAAMKRATQRLYDDSIDSQFALTGLRQDGTLFPTICHVAVVELRDGHKASVAFFTDMTEQQRTAAILRRVERALRALSACNAVLMRVTDERELLQTICQIIVEKGGYRLVWVGFLEDTTTQRVRPMAYAGYADHHVETFSRTEKNPENGQEPACTAIRTGKPCLITDMQTDRLLAPRREEAQQHGYTACIALPLISDEHVIGALSVYAAEPEAFDTEEVDLLTQLADNLAYGITAVRNRRQRQQAEAEIRRLNADLEQRVAARTADLLRANEILQTEINERKRTEAALRESQRFTEKIAHTIPDLLYIYDMIEQRNVYVNREVGPMLGYTAEEIQARGAGMISSLLHPDDREQAINRQLQRIATARDGEILELEYRLRHANGEWRWLQVRETVFMRTASGQPQQILGVAQDITGRKHAEAQLCHYAAELERSAAETRQFVYIVSHDLRAPLVNLKGFAAELRSAMEHIGPALAQTLQHLPATEQHILQAAIAEDVPEALEFIDASVSQMDRFINALLKLSRLGYRELKRELLDMNTLVTHVLQTLAHQIEERGASVTVHPLCNVIADYTAMEQIVANILNNAVIYLEPTRPGHIEVSSEYKHNLTTFSIRDNGRGIAPGDIAQIFTPFRRAGKPDVPGEGMGLAYVKTLVRRHGGHIWCESEPGVGTTFTFTIPDPPMQEEHNE